MDTKKLKYRKIIKKHEIYFNDYVDSLELPMCVKVEDAAFKNAHYFNKLYLPTCEYIGNYAFFDCRFKDKLELPRCKHIGESAFARSIFRGFVNLPECEFIGVDAFGISKFYGVLNIPKCKFIGEYAFASSFFTLIKIGENVEISDWSVGGHWNEFIIAYKENKKQAGTYLYTDSSYSLIDFTLILK